MSDGDSAALELRACKPGDVAAVVSFFNENVVHTLPDNFAACIKAAAQEDGFLPGEGRIACVLALSGGELIGAVVTALWKLQDSSASGRIPFELFKAPPANAEIVVLKAIAVTPLQRRRSVGTELLRAGIRHLAMENARCAGVMVIVPVNAIAVNALLEENAFARFGRLRNSFSRKAKAGKAATAAPDKEDGVVWVMPFESLELQEYRSSGQPTLPGDAIEGVDEPLVDLSDPELVKRKIRRLPRWLRNCLLQFFLPLGVVFSLFLMTYLFVAFGPAERLGLMKLMDGAVAPKGGAQASERAALERAAAGHEEAPGSLFGFVPGGSLDYDDEL